MLAVEDVASAEHKCFTTIFLGANVDAFTQHEFTAELHGIKALPFDTKVLLCAVIFHERTDWKLKYAGPPAPADVVKTILQLLYNLTAELTLTVMRCTATELLLVTSHKDGPDESASQRRLNDDCEASNYLKKQLGKTARHSYSHECLASPSSSCAD